MSDLRSALVMSRGHVNADEEGWGDEYLVLFTLEVAPAAAFRGGGRGLDV